MDHNSSPQAQAEEHVVVGTADGRELKIVFTPGCFDNFDGTQEELNALVDEIKGLFASGEAFLKAVPVDEADPILDELKDTIRPNTRQ